MVDALGVQQVQGVGHVARRPFLAGVGHGVQAELAGRGVDPHEFRGRVVDLGRVQADAVDRIEQRPGLRQGGERVALGQVAEERHDEPGTDAVAPAALGQCSGYAADDHVQRDSAGRVRLRVEERFHVHDAVGGAAVEVRRGELVEVALGDEHARSEVVDVEERLQVGELVGRADLGDGPPRHLDVVAPRQLEQHRRLQRALEVYMQLHLGGACDQQLDRGVDGSVHDAP